MSAQRYFLFLFIEDRRLRQFLDLAIYALNPQEKWPAHVTLAGPFESKIEAPRALEFPQQVFLLGRGRFSNRGRHTVFLHIGSRDLWSRVNKPDFKDAIPHLSLYSGRDKNLSDSLYDRLEGKGLFGSFYANQLTVVESNQQYSLNFPLYVDTSILDRTRDLSLDELKRLPADERIDIAVTALSAGFEKPLPMGVRFL